VKSLDSNFIIFSSQVK